MEAFIVSISGKFEHLRARICHRMIDKGSILKRFNSPEGAEFCPSGKAKDRMLAGKADPVKNSSQGIGTKGQHKLWQPLRFKVSSCNRSQDASLHGEEMRPAVSRWGLPPLVEIELPAAIHPSR